MTENVQTRSDTGEKILHVFFNEKLHYKFDQAYKKVSRKNDLVSIQDILALNHQPSSDVKISESQNEIIALKEMLTCCYCNIWCGDTCSITLLFLFKMLRTWMEITNTCPFLIS